jgi:hypothetical protein
MTLPYAEPASGRATVISVERCDPRCLATTLLSMEATNATLSALGDVQKKHRYILTHRLYVMAREARGVVDWIAKTASVRGNHAPVADPILRAVVDGLLPFGDEPGFAVYGEVPMSSASSARNVLKLAADVPFAGLIEVPFDDEKYVAFTAAALIWGEGKQESLPYAEFRELTATVADNLVLSLSDGCYVPLSSFKFEGATLLKMLESVVATLEARSLLPKD